MASSSRVRKARTKSEEEQRKALNEERKSLVLLRRPVTTITYSVRELFYLALESLHKMMQHKVTLLLVVLISSVAAFLYQMEGPHQESIQRFEKYFLWYLWWIGLGVLSSVGLGTGLHTFILYLGPHIAAVTMAAYECGTTDFPDPPYPVSIVCPDDESVSNVSVSFWSIMAKVRLEAICWGAGTALGELPPYFMARAHRLTGYDPDEEKDEFDELQEKATHPDQLNIFDRAKLRVENLVERMGFFGILICASIPNPLFDLAGITCGHFLVPFWTFFGATLIGKAFVKMHLQKSFVILAFNENLINHVVEYLSLIPVIGHQLESPFKDFLAEQKEKLHQRTTHTHAQAPSLISRAFDLLILGMVLAFVYSIINSLAQNYHRRIHRKKADGKAQTKRD